VTTTPRVPQYPPSLLHIFHCVPCWEEWSGVLGASYWTQVNRAIGGRWPRWGNNFSLVNPSSAPSVRFVTTGCLRFSHSGESSFVKPLFHMWFSIGSGVVGIIGAGGIARRCLQILVNHDLSWLDARAQKSGVAWESVDFG
jgi:hypothetical protein